MPTLLILYCISTCMGCGVSRHGGQSAGTVPLLNVIFETDMGNDVDDALALDMLYKYQDEGKIKLLCVNSNKNSIYSPLYISLLNNWYGYPFIPVGTLAPGGKSDDDPRNYTAVAYNYTRDGQRVFKTPDTTGKWQEAVSLYRRILSKQPDHSVTIISVGFSTNLARLLQSPPDQYSSLPGRELVGRKVKLLSMMAGCFTTPTMAEYNVEQDIAAAEKVFAAWPGTVVASPFELGNAITYPATSIQHDFTWTPHHPVVIAYENYRKMPYDRPTWDLTSVLYAVEGADNYFSVTGPGTITVNKQGHTLFTAAASGQHFYLTVNDQQKVLIKKRFIELVTRKPRHYLQR
jgi:inosine-uridine nucleoside N-ribohydrolase